MPKKKEIPEQFSEAVSKYLAFEYSTTDMAESMGVAKATVLKWMVESGISRHSPSVMISKKAKGRPGARLGHKWTDEQKASAAIRTKGRMPTTLGFKFSPESRKKMSDSAKQRFLRDGRPKNVRSSVREVVPDAEQALRVKTRNKCKSMLRRILTMARTKKDERRAELRLGYTKQDLRNHLESQFMEGMSWDARHSFHIDHIRPYIKFFQEGVFDPAVINALSNLQVLTPEENRAKGVNLEGPRNRRNALIVDSTGTRVWS